MYYLAQINIAKAIAPIDSEIMQGFVNQIAAINQLAEQSKGYIWRLEGAYENALAIQAFEDSNMLINMSMWQDLQSFTDFVYKSAHKQLIKDKHQWFEKPTKPIFAMWWQKAGTYPTVEDGKNKLHHLEEHGVSETAFTMRKHFAPPEFVA